MTLELRENGVRRKLSSDPTFTSSTSPIAS